MTPTDPADPAAGDRPVRSRRASRSVRRGERFVSDFASPDYVLVRPEDQVAASSVAAIVRQRLDSLAPGEFLHSRDVPGVRTAVNAAFALELAARADLVRVRPGLFWKGTKSRFGAGRPSALAAALAIAGTGAGPSGWSAVYALGLTTLVPVRPTIAVAGRRVRIAGCAVVTRSNLQRVLLNPTEIAVLEVVHGGLLDHDDASASAALFSKAGDGVIDPVRLRAVAAAEHPRRIAVELEALLGT